MTHLKWSEVERKNKTGVYKIVSSHDESILGYVFWFNAWRQYVFQPVTEHETIWSRDCLQELDEIIKIINIKDREL